MEGNFSQFFLSPLGSAKADARPNGSADTLNTNAVLFFSSRWFRFSRFAMMESMSYKKKRDESTGRSSTQKLYARKTNHEIRPKTNTRARARARTHTHNLENLVKKRAEKNLVGECPSKTRFSAQNNSL